MYDEKRRALESNGTPDIKIGPSSDFLEKYTEASEADPESVAQLKKYIADLPPLPKNPYFAATAIRRYFLEHGFHYDIRCNTLDEVIKEKGGSCLGLALLYSVALREKGYEPSFDVAHNLHDVYFEEEQEIFSEYWNKEKEPEFPTENHPDPLLRFETQSHPLLFLDKQYFEPTISDPDEPDEFRHCRQIQF
ncbi:MAG: hypothetical protein WCT11_05045 [Candidatus Magasanikbacteria bacterium]|jgi:hypothetical protein